MTTASSIVLFCEVVVVAKSKRKKKIKTMDLILLCLGVFLLTFVVICLVIFCVTGGSEPSTLIGCVFAVCGTECGAMAWIKNVKEKKEAEKQRKKMMKNGGNDDEY